MPQRQKNDKSKSAGEEETNRDGLFHGDSVYIYIHDLLAICLGIISEFSYI